MHDKLLLGEIDTLLKHCQIANLRYRHLIFSSKASNFISQSVELFSALCPDYKIWHPQKGQNIPLFPCPRKQFIEQVFNQPQDLLLIQPGHWLQTWQLVDKQAFWSALSTRHGGKNVIVITPASYEFLKLIPAYFTEQPCSNTELSLWISNKNK